MKDVAYESVRSLARGHVIRVCQYIMLGGVLINTKCGMGNWVTNIKTKKQIRHFAKKECGCMCINPLK